MIEKPIAFSIHRKPCNFFNLAETCMGRVIGSLALDFVKPLCHQPPGELERGDVAIIVDVLLTEHLLTCPKALSKPHEGHGIDTGPSQQ